MRDWFNAVIKRYEIAWDLGMGFLAIVYVAVGFALDESQFADLRGLLVVETLLTVVFVAEFSLRLAAAHDRVAYLRGHWIDAIALIPVARGLRIARLLRVLRL